MVSRALPPRRGGPLLHAAPRRPSRPGSPPDYHLSGHPHPLSESDHSGLLVSAPMALHGDCCVRGHAVLRRHDCHHGHQRLSARLLPRRLRRGQRVDHGQPQLGRLHGNVHPDRMGHAARPGESVRHPGRHHVCLPLLNNLLAVVWKTDEAVARPYVLWGREVVFTERPWPAFSRPKSHLFESINVVSTYCFSESQ